MRSQSARRSRATAARPIAARVRAAVRRSLGTLLPAGALPTVLLLGGIAALAPPAAAQEVEEEIPPIQEEGDYYIVNFSEDVQEGLSLDEFVKICQQATGLNFVVPQDTTTLLQQKKVRMFGPKRIPKDEFYSFFQIIMFINEFACIEVGPSPLSVIVIQNIGLGASGRGGSQVKQDAVYVLPEELESYRDQPATMITTVVTLPNTDVRQLANALRGMTAEQGNTTNMLPAGASDSVILTGFGSSIYQLAQLLYLIDEESALEDPANPQFDQVRLEFAAAGDVKEYVEQLLEASAEAVRNAQRAQGAAQGQPAATAQAEVPAKIIVDARTNSLLVMALPDDMPRIKEMIARLDSEVIEPERNYHIYTLENVGAEELAETLEEFLQDAQSVTQSGSGAGGRTGEAATGGTSEGDDVIVVAEPSTNSLLIAANKTAYAEVTELIRALDRRANQVLIETALIELSSDDFTDIGVELGLAEIPGAGETSGFGITNFGLSTLEDLDSDGIADARVPTFADGITAGILDGDDFSLPFLLRLLQTKSNVNVLSVPSILVNDNGSATVSTLDEVPFTQVTAFGGSGGGQTQENFEGYQEAGITLTISPSISASRYLRLGIELEVSNFEGSTQGSNIPPPRVTRTLTTSINVPDGDTMVIGGVITNNTTWQRDQIPWLGDLPLVGWLFGRELETEEKRTLYFFVTPHILSDRDFADLAEISYRKKLDASNVIGADRMRIIDPEFGVDEQEDPFASFEMPLYRVPPAGELPPEEIGMTPTEQAELLDEARAEERDQP